MEFLQDDICSINSRHKSDFVYMSIYLCLLSARCYLDVLDTLKIVFIYSVRVIIARIPSSLVAL